jgi:hypothetical protein
MITTLLRSLTPISYLGSGFLNPGSVFGCLFSRELLRFLLGRLLENGPSFGRHGSKLFPKRQDGDSR